VTPKEILSGQVKAPRGAEKVQAALGKM
jgi:hypothetical protein